MYDIVCLSFEDVINCGGDTIVRLVGRKEGSVAGWASPHEGKVGVGD